MKKFICLLLLFLIVSAFPTEAQMRPVKDNIACLWGIKHDSGHWVIPPKYTLLEEGPGHLLTALLDGKWGVIKRDGTELIPAEYDKLEPITHYEKSNGQRTISSETREMTAVKAGKWGVIDMTGKVLIPLEYDAIYKGNYDDYFYTTLNKKLGLRIIDKELLPCRYTFLRPMSDRGPFVIGNGDVNRCSYNSFFGTGLGVININGDTLIPCRFDAINSLCQGTQWSSGCPLIVKVNDSTGFYKFDGTCIIEPKYKFSEVARYNGYTYLSNYASFLEQYTLNVALVFTENGKFGVVKPYKGQVQPAVFDSVEMDIHFSKRPAIFRVKKDGKWGLLNADGTMLRRCRYKTIHVYMWQIFVAKKENKFKQFAWRRRVATPRHVQDIAGPLRGKVKRKKYEKILPGNQPGGQRYYHLVSGNQFYTVDNDTLIRRAKVLATFAGDVAIIEPNDAIEGKGVQAKRLEIKGISMYGSRYSSLETKTGKIIFDRNYKIVSPPKQYKSFHYMEDSPNTVVITHKGKVGMINTDGKLVADTIFEALGKKLVKGMMFVKTGKTHDGASGKCIDGWAIADENGKLLTAPIFRNSEMYGHVPRQFLMTNEGVGVFDLYERKFTTPSNFKNGFFTGDGSCIMQTNEHLFIPYSVEGIQMSAKPWRRLMQLAGESEMTREYSRIRMIEGSLSDHRPEELEDAWLLMNGDSMAILNRNKLILDRRTVLDRVYNYFVEADVRDNAPESPWKRGPVTPHVTVACPRLDAGENPTYNIYGTLTESPKKVPKEAETIAISDSLVLRMVRRIAPGAQYHLHPDDGGIWCRCYASEYKEGREDLPQDPRQITSVASSAYYRVVYRDKKIISLQIIDYFQSHWYNGAKRKMYNDRSRFENYVVGKDHWDTLNVSQLFRPGYERILNTEIVTSIQKADSLDIDCHNPASFLEQCEGRFSLSERGLWVYMKDNSTEEFIPLVIPWGRIRGIIPERSPAYTLATKARKH